MADARTLCCDYDRVGDRRRGGTVPAIPYIRAVMNTLALRVRGLEQHRTRRGWHLVIHLAAPLEPAERICAEAILGSDLHRCTLDLMRVVACRQTPIRSNFWKRRTSMLFERKLA